MAPSRPETNYTPWTTAYPQEFIPEWTAAYSQEYIPEQAVAHRQKYIPKLAATYPLEYIPEQATAYPQEYTPKQKAANPEESASEAITWDEVMSGLHSSSYWNSFTILNLVFFLPCPLHTPFKWFFTTTMHLATTIFWALSWLKSCSTEPAYDVYCWCFCLPNCVLLPSRSVFCFA